MNKIFVPLILLLLAPTATAMQMEASGYQIDGAFGIEGNSAAYTFRASDVQSGMDDIRVHAAEGVVFTFSQTGPYVDASACAPYSPELCDVYGQPVDNPETLNGPETYPDSGVAHQLQLKSVAFQGIQQLRMFPLHGDLDIQVLGPKVESTWIEKPCVTGEGIREEPTSDNQVTPACSGDYDRDYVFFHSQSLEGPVMVQNTTGASDLLIQGDLVMEMFGITMQAHGKHNEEFRSGAFYESPGSVPAGTYTTSFVRMELKGATVQLNHADGVVHSEWSMAKGTASGSGALDLLDDQGAIVDSMRGEFLFESTATADGAVLEFERGEGLDTSTTAAMGNISLSWAWALLIVPAIVLGLVLRRRTPSMEQVEAALDAGEFRKAATMSHKILKRHPFAESAHLSRAISMTRLGRPTAAVAALRPYLRDNDPGDGTLHYVLGMALLDLGKRDEATSAFKDAVARTPALLQQIAPDLDVDSLAPEGYS